MHADSVDDVSAIFAEFQSRFGITLCDPSVMLGMRRELTEQDGVRYLEMSMATYITDLHTEWTAIMRDRGTPMRNDSPEIPFPEGAFLSVKGTEKYPLPSQPEIDAVIPLYRKAVGQLLWLSRMVMPDILFATSMLSRVLSCPGHDTLDLALRVVRYAYTQRHRGIRFRSTPRALSCAHTHDLLTPANEMKSRA
eukprot:SAG31_NODE_14372_length_810_cov_4.291139_1_plen_194_part_00